ncbi:LOW QUALITY PROTEIN: TRAF3-interacting protein 1 [Leguminivora glycinivorella]|uniref:LOW QUALITY PROTEIN: TRAF3-interacting protein 1 n=1 Tax=Leguminivora glycinivorella TaxID=1035111 RepID=UPI00200D5DEB|nr:LOW QUALITY PROTEIN: TRAF3-interacting protein 1 [Leguminivora glycinivorella]
MEKELDQSIIKSTQTSLGKYVKRPPLSDKLLKKPPFRFLHDIITTVLKTTGFFEGLFEEDELVSDNVKDRESKILFLNKVISVVGLANGKPLSVKPSKIVAGQEPDKTNELLQCLAQVLDKKISSDEAVRKYKESVISAQTAKDTKAKEPAKTTKKIAESNKLTSRSNEKLTTNQKKEKRDGSLVKNGTKEKVSKSKDKESTLKQESPPKVSSQKPKVISKKSLVENVNQPDNNTQSNKKLSKAPSKDLTNSLDNKDEPEKNGKQSEAVKQELEPQVPQELEPDELVKEKLDTSYTIADTDLNSSSSQDLLETQNKFEGEEKNNVKTPFPEPVASDENHRDIQVHSEERVHENLQEKEEERSVNKIQNNINLFRQNSSETTYNKNNENRIASANKHSIVASQPARPTSVRPSSSRPGAPRLRDKHTGAAQGPDNLLVGKVNIITENAPNEEDEDTSIIIVEQPQARNASVEEPDQLALNEHGHLVQQILDSQKEFSQVSGKTEIEWQFGAQKAREASNQEIEQVKFNIQAVSRAANPLGKLLDHIQEDVEVMRQELQQWTRTYDETSKELAKQKAANDDSLLPLHTKIKNLDADIKEKQDKIDDLKIVIHKNSSRIEKLLASGSVQ